MELNNDGRGAAFATAAVARSCRKPDLWNVFVGIALYTSIYTLHFRKQLNFSFSLFTVSLLNFQNMHKKRKAFLLNGLYVLANIGAQSTSTHVVGFERFVFIQNDGLCSVGVQAWKTKAADRNSPGFDCQHEKSRKRTFRFLPWSPILPTKQV